MCCVALKLAPQRAKNVTQTAMTNIVKQRIFLLLTFRLLGNIHFQEKPLQFLQLFLSLLQRVWGFGLFYVEPIHSGQLLRSFSKQTLSKMSETRQPPLY